MSIANRAEARVERTERLELRASEDVVRLRQTVRERAVAAGFTLIDQTKIVTAASDLGRNPVEHGGGGEARISVLSSGARRGLRLEFVDTGPGIADIALALTDGYTTGNGLGLGLSGARRLSDEFDIDSTPGAGTRVMIVRWSH
jgi:serine/threonine-protein kinase RsbT